MAFTSPAQNQKVLHSHITQLINALTGVSGAGEQVSLTQYNNSSNYALDVRNLDTTNGYGLRVRDGSSNNLLLVYKNNIALGASAANDALAINCNISGIVYIGDSANTNMTAGLTLNQAAADNQILAGKSSDVGHAMTGVVEADTYVAIGKAQATSGGALFQGFKDGDGDAGMAVIIEGTLGEAADTTHTAAGLGVVSVDCYVTDGSTGRTGTAANGNLFVVRSTTTTRFIVDSEGDLFADGSDVTVYDEYDDVAMLRAFDLARGQRGLIETEWDRFVKYNEDDLVRVGILGAPRSQGGLINYTLLARFQNGAIWQLNTKLQSEVSELRQRLALAEQRLAALPQGA